MDNKTKQYQKDIKAWLKSNDKDFDAGYELFVRFSHNRALAVQLARIRRLPKLEYELQKIAAREFLKESPVMPIRPVMKAAARNQEHSQAESQIEAAGKKLVVIDDRINYDELPDDLQKVYDETREKYKIMRAIHEKMKQALKDHERAELRAELVSIDDQIAKNWEILDTWASLDPESNQDSKEGELADEQEPERDTMLTAAEVTKELNACRSYLSRNVKKVSSLKGKKQEELFTKLAERVAILEKHNAEIKESTRKELVELGLIDASE